MRGQIQDLRRDRERDWTESETEQTQVPHLVDSDFRITTRPEEEEVLQNYDKGIFLSKNSDSLLFFRTSDGA